MEPPQQKQQQRSPQELAEDRARARHNNDVFNALFAHAPEQLQPLPLIDPPPLPADMMSGCLLRLGPNGALKEEAFLDGDGMIHSISFPPASSGLSPQYSCAYVETAGRQMEAAHNHKKRFLGTLGAAPQGWALLAALVKNMINFRTLQGLKDSCNTAIAQHGSTILALMEQRTFRTHQVSPRRHHTNTAIRHLYSYSCSYTISLYYNKQPWRRNKTNDLDPAEKKEDKLFRSTKTNHRRTYANSSTRGVPRLTKHHQFLTKKTMATMDDDLSLASSEPYNNNNNNNNNNVRMTETTQPFYDKDFLSCNEPEPAIQAAEVPEAMEVQTATEVQGDTNETTPASTTDNIDNNKDGFTEVKKVKKSVKMSRDSPQFSRDSRAVKHRFLLGLQDCPANGAHKECAAEVMRKLAFALKILEKMLAKKNSAGGELLIYSWSSSMKADGTFSRPLNIETLKMLGWDQVKDEYLYKPTNINWIPEVWFRIYIGYDCKQASSMRSPHKMVKAWILEVDETRKNKSPLVPTIKASADVLQAENTKDIGYFHGATTEGAFDVLALSKALSKAIHIPVSVHIAHVGYIDPNGKVLLSAKEKSRPAIGDPKIMYSNIRGYHVEVEENMTALVSARLTELFNVGLPEHIYPMQFRHRFINTETVGPRSRNMLIALAKQHHACNQSTLVSDDIHHIKGLDKVLVYGEPITVRRILMDLLAADLDGTTRAHAIDQVNVTDLGSTQLVYHTSQQLRVESIIPYTYCLAKTFTPMFTAGLMPLEKEEFAENLKACFTEAHVQANEEVIFDSKTGAFISPNDVRNEEAFALVFKGTKMHIELNGDESVYSAISAYSTGAVSTTSAATKMRLARSEAEVALMRKEAAAKDEKVAAIVKEAAEKEKARAKEMEELRAQMAAWMAAHSAGAAAPMANPVAAPMTNPVEAPPAEVVIDEAIPMEAEYTTTDSPGALLAIRRVALNEDVHRMKAKNAKDLKELLNIGIVPKTIAKARRSRSLSQSKLSICRARSLSKGSSKGSVSNGSVSKGSAQESMEVDDLDDGWAPDKAQLEDAMGMNESAIELEDSMDDSKHFAPIEEVSLEVDLSREDIEENSTPEMNTNSAGPRSKGPAQDW